MGVAIINAQTGERIDYISTNLWSWRGTNLLAHEARKALADGKPFVGVCVVFKDGRGGRKGSVLRPPGEPGPEVAKNIKIYDAGGKALTDDMPPDLEKAFEVFEKMAAQRGWDHTPVTPKPRSEHEIELDAAYQERRAAALRQQEELARERELELQLIQQRQAEIDAINLALTEDERGLWG